MHVKTMGVIREITTVLIYIYPPEWLKLKTDNIKC